MRTFQLQIWSLRARLQDLVNGERRYSVSGSIVFEFHPHLMDAPDPKWFAEAIQEVDREFPWRDDVHPDVAYHARQFYLSNGEFKFHEFNNPPLQNLWFFIQHNWHNLRRPQVYAYEKYLAKLAEELSKKKIPYITEVRSVMEVVTATSFRIA